LFAAISGDHSQALWLVQLFLAVAVLGGLVLASQVAERARLARDLHDSVSQRAGSTLWWRAVRAVLAASAGHLDREERDVLPHCVAGLTVSSAVNSAGSGSGSSPHGRWTPGPRSAGAQHKHARWHDVPGNPMAPGADVADRAGSIDGTSRSDIFRRRRGL
jgi:Histidine kinase